MKEKKKKANKRGRNVMKKKTNIKKACVGDSLSAFLKTLETNIVLPGISLPWPSFKFHG